MESEQIKWSGNSAKSKQQLFLLKNLPDVEKNYYSQELFFLLIQERF